MGSDATKKNNGSTGVKVPVSKRKTEGKYPSPFILLLTVLFSVAAIEIFSLTFLQRFSLSQNPASDLILDGLAQALLIFPLLYFLFYRPIGVTINRLRKAEDELRRSHDILDERVKKRTAELTEAYDKLQWENDQRRENEKMLQELGESLQMLSAHCMKIQEEERSRISMGLHDELGQSLLALKLQIQTLESGAKPDRSTSGKDFSLALAQIDSILDTTHRLSRDLTPLVLQNLGLAQEIQRLIDDEAHRHQLAASFELDDIDDILEKDEQLHIYRIFQEAISNVVRHAGAKRIRATAHREPGGIVFRLKDDGRGFDQRSPEWKNYSKDRLGIIFMRERARMAGGTFNLESSPGEGTSITVTISAGESGR